MPRRVYPDLLTFFKDQKDRQTGLTAQDVADELDISYSYMSMLKWGAREPDLELALRIAARCNVPLESLIRRQRQAS